MEDEPVIKPRRLGGTPAYKYRNRLGWYCFGGMYAIYLVTTYFLNDRIDRKLVAGWYDESKFIKEKKLRMRNFMTQNAGTNIPQREMEIFLDETRDDTALSTIDGDLK